MQGLIGAPRQFKHELALCAIFKDEAPYLKEWIEFHNLVGVQRFYLYNNLSTDNYLEVLEPYIKSNLVELKDWPYKYQTAKQWNKIQCTAYKDAIKKTKGLVRWLALIDTDEFLVPVEKDTLVDLLAEYTQFGGVGANWQIYGTSNVPKIPQGKLLIETLILKSEKEYDRNRHVKSIVQPLQVKNCISPHYCIYVEGFGQVNENKEPFFWDLTPYVSVNKIRINHYWSRDEEYFYRSKINRIWTGDAQKKIDRLKMLDKAIDDGNIQRFVPELRKRMFR